MINTFIFIFLIGIIFLLGFMFYYFIEKANKNGKTSIKWKIALYKLLQIEFESKHDSGSKK